MSQTKEGWDQYVEDVTSGKQKVGRYVRLAVERHVRDMARQRTEGFPYYFSAKKARFVCDFFPTVLRHSIGEHAGEPFVLEDWQKFFLAMLFGWQRVDGRGRRFRNAFFTVARKNGKSTLAAGIALYIAALDPNPISNQPEPRSQVILAATKKEQAEKVIFAELLRMRYQALDLREMSTVANKVVEFKLNGGTVQCVGSDRPYDGLNPMLVSLDETHAFTTQHRKFYSTMITGSGSRVQPILLTTTTAGDDQSFIWLEQINFCKNVLEQTVDEEQQLALIYELDEDDDPLDPDNWIKGNPNLGVSITYDFLEAQSKPARTDPTALNRFKRYHANVLVSSTERIFSVEDFDKCAGKLSDWKKDASAVCFGIDLGGRDDLAALAAVAKFRTGQIREDGSPIYRYEGRTWSYIATNTRRDLKAVPFCNWIDQGLITVSDTPISDLMEDMIEQYWELYAKEALIDPYQAAQFGELCQSRGVIITAMHQTTSNFNEPIGDFRQACADQRFTHGSDPVLRWCLQNAVAVKDRQDRWMMDKANSAQKIDPLVALLMAWRGAQLAKDRFDGDYFMV